MSTYYRKLELGERIADGDGWFSRDFTCTTFHEWAKADIGTTVTGGNSFRPVTITEAPPEPPAHRVEDETWTPGLAGVYRPFPNLACARPVEDDGNWLERAKRICAGQEALKVLKRQQYGLCGLEWVEERDRILSLLED